jgi:uncharacterized protein YecT (DUF1311 family)
MHFRQTAIALFLALAGAAAHAADASDCSNRDLTQIDMNVCAYQAFQKQDRALNAVYGELVKQEDAEGLRRLQAAQRAWLQFRDLECLYEAPDGGGSIAPQLKATCLAVLTRERLLDFKRVLADKPQ